MGGRSTNISGTLGFLKRDEKYKSEKPYVLRYHPGEDIPNENILKEFVPNIPLYDIRNMVKPPRFDENGLQLRLIHTNMTYQDFNYDDKIKSVFLPEIRANLSDFFGTSNIQIFEYKVTILRPT